MQAIHYYFIRHGETVANATNKVQGWTDSPLTPLGKEQMQHLSHSLSRICFDIAFCSDLNRSITSSQILLSQQNKHIKATPLKEFRELYYGGLEGHDLQQAWPKSLSEEALFKAKQNIPQNQWIPQIIDTLSQRDPEGKAEDFMTFWDRLEEGMLKVYDDAIEYRLDHMTPVVNVAIVSHHTPIRSFLHEVFLYFNLASPLGYGHYGHVLYRNGSYTLLEWDQA